ncbi:MAG: HAMP domain-containing sensor histidine kinase [Aeromicrobium sp.]|uniref:sensor histidine kinase n=1 Tax=Aeromicrobium sp. TaxID=1871063 RepID=UPI003C5A8CAF
MGRRVAATIVLVAFMSMLIVRIVVVTTGSPLLIGVAIVVVLTGAAVTGFIIAAQISAAYEVLIRRDRAFTVAASHELRTPITALRLSLEDLTLWQTTPPEVSDELNRAITELDRLSAAVTQLLEQHRDDQRAGGDPVDLTTLTESVVSRWRGTVEPARQVHFTGAAPAPVRTDAGSVRRVIAGQLAQFGEHGTGIVSIDVARVRQTIKIRVCDESSPRFSPGVIHGPATGKNVGDSLTLEEAASVAEALGGYLAVEDSPTTCISLTLPDSVAAVVL